MYITSDVEEFHLLFVTIQDSRWGMYTYDEKPKLTIFGTLFVVKTSKLFRISTKADIMTWAIFPLNSKFTKCQVKKVTRFFRLFSKIYGKTQANPPLSIALPTFIILIHNHQYFFISWSIRVWNCINQISVMIACRSRGAIIMNEQNNCKSEFS